MINCLPLPSLNTIIDFKRIHKLLLIPVIALIGDAIVNHYTFPLWPLLLKCCSDSSTHFMVAALSWSYVANISIVNNRNHTATILLSGLLASLIDVDHFIASGALTLQAATSLSQRPVLHCTTVLTVVALLVFLVSVTKQSTNLLKVAWIILTATWTHHWRDGYRRGIWICPVGSTSPYSHFLYLSGLIILPVTLKLGFVLASDLVSKPNLKNLPQVYLV